MRVNAHNRVGVTAEDRSERTDTSVDVTAEEEEEEQKIQQMEKRATKSSRFNQCLSLRNILTFFMGSLSMMAIVVLSAVSFSFFASNVVENVESVRDLYFSNLISQFIFTLESTTTSVISSATAIENGVVDIHDFDHSLRPYLWRTFRKFQDASTLQTNVYTGLPTGQMGGYGSVDGMEHVFTNHKDIYTLEVIPVANNVTGELLYQYTFVSNYTNLFDAPSYKLAQNITSPRWTEVYAMAGFPQFLWLSFVISIRNQSTGEWLGYFCSDMTTDNLGKLVHTEASRLKDSHILVVERRTGYTIALSDLSPLFKVNDDQSIERFDGSNAKDQKIVETLKYLRGKYGRYFGKLGRERHHEKLRIGSQTYFITFQELVDRYGLEWVMIQCTNRWTFYEFFFDSVIAMSVISAFLLLLSIVLAVLIGTIVMRPLRHLLVEVRHLEHMQLEEVESGLKNLSFISEVRGLQTGFLIMTKRLKTLRSFIPDHVLAALESDGHASQNVNASNASLKRNNREKDDTASDSSTMLQSGTGSSLSQHTRNTLAIGVRHGRLTVAVIEIGNAMKVLEEGSSNEYSNSFRDIITMVNNLSRPSGAELVSCTYNQIIFVWNAFNPFEDHIRKACTFVDNCRNQLQKLKALWSKQMSDAQMTMHVGLCSSTGYYGNIGSTKQRFFTVFGPVLDDALHCATVASEWGVTVVASSSIVQRVENNYMTRPFTTLANDASFVMYEIGQAKKVHADEWMYEMEQKESLNKWSPCVKAFELWQQKKYSEASKLLVEYLEKESGDAVAQNMLSLCLEADAK